MADIHKPNYGGFDSDNWQKRIVNNFCPMLINGKNAVIGLNKKCLNTSMV